MSRWLLVLLIATQAIPGDDSKLRNAAPGPEAAAAGELFEGDDKSAAYAAFVEQVRQGSDDPWSYHGLANCAAQHQESRGEILALLESLPEDAPLSLFARGSIALSDEDPNAAEELMHRAVIRAPDFALAYNTLGILAEKRQGPKAAIALLTRALELAPGLEAAKHNLGFATYAHADELASSSQLTEALRAYERAGELFAETGDQIRQGDVILSKAGLLAKMERRERP